MRNKTMDKGFTLVELLVAMAISSIVMIGIYSAFKSQQDSYLAQEQVAEVQQNLRAGLNFLTQELRKAGYDPDSTGGAGFTAATANTLTFTYVADDDGRNNDGDSDTDEDGELETARYNLDDAYSDGDDDLVRWFGGIWRATAENIDNIEFYYTLSDGTQTLAPAILNDIRAVSVSILARADRPDSNYTHTSSYTTASGVVWTPGNDNYRRRFQILRINCRNMGL